MELGSTEKSIIIAPQIYVSLEHRKSANASQEPAPRQTHIPMVWIQDGDNFRLDIDLPERSVLDIYFSSQVGSLHINGETIWENHASHAVGMAGAHAVMTPGGLRLTCTSGGPLHILARCLFETNSGLEQ